MDKCRACLMQSKALLSIYAYEKDNITFADMMNSLANVKIAKNDEACDKICRRCRRRLTEAYEFKCLLERSNDVLNEMLNVKKITFNNLNDIKDIKIEIDENEYNVNKKSEEFNEYFKDGVNEISYNNTVIKKLEPGDVKLEDTKPVLEFLKTIDQNEEENFDDDMIYIAYDTDGDDEYLPPEVPKVKRKYNKKNKISAKLNTKEPAVSKKKKCVRKKVSNPEQLKKVRIQPVYLPDLKLVSSKTGVSVVPNPSTKKMVYRSKEKMCPHCGIMTKSFKSHLKTHMSPGEKSYQCDQDQCSKKFYTLQALEKHIELHNAPKDFKCHLCVAAFKQKGTLKSHMSLHTDERRYPCSICGKRFKRKETLRRHELAHNFANKNIACELCNRTFFDKFRLNHHMRVHTGERPYNCELCSQPYSYKRDFNQHCFKKHGVFLKRRSVNVMNEEVLKREKIIMRDLLLRINGLKQNDDSNPFDFEGPQAALAFEQAVKELESKQIAIDIHLKVKQ